MRRRTLFFLAAAATAAAALLGGVLAGSPSAGPVPSVKPEVAATRLLDGFAAGDTAAQVAQLEQRVESNPADA